MSDALPALRAGFTSRPATLADVRELTVLLNDYFEAAFGVRRVTPDEMRRWFTAPGFDLPGSTRVVLAPDGRMVGGVAVLDAVSVPVHPEILAFVHPDFEGQGIGTFLLCWGEERARQTLARVPAGLRVSLTQGVSDTHEPSRRLLERFGWRAIRHSWLMMIELPGPPAGPRWPAGIVVQTYLERPDLRALYRATNEAFRDHWGHVEVPEEEGLRRWQHRLESDKELDLSLWFMALDGDEIAGVALCLSSVGEDPDMGFVNQLAVRRPWRRRGLGLALLQHTFGEFYRRGRKRVGLGVDADNLTGATRLYEKAGMHAANQMTHYSKELRPGRELGRESLEGES